MQADQGIEEVDILDNFAEMVAMHSVPKHIRSGNEPKFIQRTPDLVRSCRRLDALHRAWLPLGERLRRELSQPIP
jgi:hypothetical protein